MADAGSADDGAFPWHIGIFDAHCHPTDTMASIEAVRKMKARCLTIMATRAQDQQLVIDAADQLGVPRNEAGHTELPPDMKEKMVPSFGWHPWFSHQMFDESEYGDAYPLDADSKVAHYQSVLTPRSEDRDFLLSLPDPHPFREFLNRTRSNLERFPLALVGEIGLDRSFRIPDAWLPGYHEIRDESLTPGGREGRRLSPYRVHLDHQKKVLLAQLRLAGEMQRAVSVHSVQAHGAVFDVMKQTWTGYERRVLSKRERKKLRDADYVPEDLDAPASDKSNEGPRTYPPRVCLHSYSGPPEVVKQFLDPSIPAEMFFSFSTAINFSSGDSSKVEAAIRNVPDGKLLIESDLHTAGPQMDQHLEDIARVVCKLKAWTLEEGLERLAKNWHRFIFGS